MGDILKVATNDEQKSQTLRLVTGDEQWLGFHSTVNNFMELRFIFSEITKVTLLN